VTPRVTTVMLTALLTLLVASVAAQTATAAPESSDSKAATGWLRVAGLTPAGEGAEVRLSRLEDPEKQIVLPDVGFGEVLDYAAIPVGYYAATVRPAGEPAYAPRVLAVIVGVQQDLRHTVALLETGEGLTSRVFIDNPARPPAGDASVRLVNAAASTPRVDVRAVDGPTLAHDVQFGTSTGYATLPAGRWTFAATASAGDTGTRRAATSEVELADGSVNSLFVVDDGTAGMRVLGHADVAGRRVTAEGSERWSAATGTTPRDGSADRSTDEPAAAEHPDAASAGGGSSATLLGILMVAVVLAILALPVVGRFRPSQRQRADQDYAKEPLQVSQET
jgi:hypothetical protein